MALHELAGQPAPAAVLVDIEQLLAAYDDDSGELGPVSFGTSGHRGTSQKKSFNRRHILAASQAICDYRHAHHIDGPLYMGMDTHALSQPAFNTALQVLAANGVNVHIQTGGGFTPTPVISHAILTYNRGRSRGLADGIVITPSHNPPQDGGFKYSSVKGGPASTETTQWIEQQARKIMDGEHVAKTVPLEEALAAPTTHRMDYIEHYIRELDQVVNMDAIAASGVRIGVDPLGGAGIDYWEPMAERFKLNIELVNREVDPQFAFMTLDHDGKIRMDCSSPYAMAKLIALRDQFDIAFGNDPDYDRHGIVTSTGLMNPNHYLSVAVSYLFQNRPQWGADVAVGKTLVSSNMIDRVAKAVGRSVVEVPVGFKWFVDGLHDGALGIGGEESAGASFLRQDGSVWTTDKDGFILDLLAAEILANTGDSPSVHYERLTEAHGAPLYERKDAVASPPQKAALKSLDPSEVTATEVAGDTVVEKLSHAPGNGEAIGGLKVTTASGWFAARPSGTEDVYKIYAESFNGAEHLARLQSEAQAIVDAVIA